MQAQTTSNRAASAGVPWRWRGAVGAVTLMGAFLALGIELNWLVAGEGGSRHVAALCIALGMLAMLTPESRVAVGSRIAGFAAIAVGFPAMTLTFIGDPTESKVERVAGIDAIGTSVAASETTFTTADTAVLIGAHDTSVAYAASSLASSLGGPVLLTNTMGLRRDTVQELQRLGTSHAFVVGDALSANIERRLDWLGIEATRIPGGRIAAAASIAPRVDSPTMLLLVHDAASDDADGAAALAARAILGGHPIVWATPDGVPLETAAAILAQQPTEVVVWSGTPAIDADLQQLGVAIATTLPVDHGRSSVAWVAAATAPMDVAIASVAAAARGAHLVVLPPDASSSRTALPQRLSRYAEVIVVGGTASVSDEAVSERV